MNILLPNCIVCIVFGYSCRFWSLEAPSDACIPPLHETNCRLIKKISWSNLPVWCHIKVLVSISIKVEDKKCKTRSVSHTIKMLFCGCFFSTRVYHFQYDTFKRGEKKYNGPSYTQLVCHTLLNINFNCTYEGNTRV